jgi:glycosyltransferase involved in cell wall biosynthesis
MVSVVIPAYNRAHCLPRAVESALSQAAVDVEVLIVDDGSTDATRQMVMDRYGREPRVRYFHQANRGVAAARNLGLRQAGGEFIAFLDSDDRWLPGKLALQVRCLEVVPQAGMVWTDMAAVDEQGRRIHDRYLREMYHAYRRFPTPGDLFAAETVLTDTAPGIHVYSGEIFSQMVLGNLVHTSTVLLTRERASKAGTFREDLRTGEDYGFHLRVCREGVVAFADAVTVEYTVGAADALTRPELALGIARAYLVTLEETLGRDRTRIHLPARQLADCASEAYAWAGEVALYSGLAGEARLMFWRSVSWRPRWRALAFLLLSALPRSVRESLVLAVKRVKAVRP